MWEECKLFYCANLVKGEYSIVSSWVGCFIEEKNNKTLDEKWVNDAVVYILFLFLFGSLARQCLVILLNVLSSWHNPNAPGYRNIIFVFVQQLFSFTFSLWNFHPSKLKVDKTDGVDRIVWRYLRRKKRPTGKDSVIGRKREKRQSQN